MDDDSVVELSAHENQSIREAAYRQALAQAWFATALEQTKSIFTLASAGVGLSATLIFGDHVKSIKSWAPVWLLLSMVAFAFSAALCIWVFRINGRLTMLLTQNADTAREDALVGRADLGGRIAFGTGLVLLVFAAIAQIWL